MKEKFLPEVDAQEVGPLPYRFVDRDYVTAMFGFSKSTLFRRVDNGLIPPPINFGGSYSRWVQSEVHEVFKAMVAGKSEAFVRELVERLVQERQLAA